MKVAVKVLPRKEVLDTQGRAVEKLLGDNGHAVAGCQVGRYVVLDIAEANRDLALSKAKQISEFVLYNPLIETYELELLP
jgi:phosphoribosylformylglycinamidine (FGAM) synthase PurS component